MNRGETSLDHKRMPKHIAIVMDGNGRWAKERGLPRLAGHNAGMGALKEIVKRTSTIGIEHLTVYAFSTENWKRPQDEVSGIFKILVLYVDKELDEIHRNNVRVDIIGDYSKLPKDAIKKLEGAMEKTRNNTGLRFHIALNYGGRDEILKAVRELALAVSEGTFELSDLDADQFAQHLYTKGIPDPDLVIRTSGEVRLSNFLLWQTAYSELVFTKDYWPDFSPERLEDCIREYQGRARRFGGIK